ncbi:MAG: signal recognition particle protein [Gammaproteobacteria bacterium]|nr:signal recognition particle protein [Gammaproteobacteria bacterium]
MFEQLTSRLSQTFKQLRGISHFTESNIESTLKEIRFALLEADVALSVVKPFIQSVKEAAIGKPVEAPLTPAQAMLKLVHAELVLMMGSTNAELQFNTQPPAIILMAGLQGSGKTTTAGKLASYLKNREHKKVMLATTDVYRPAAIEQLHQLAQKIDVPFVDATPQDLPLDIAKRAIDQAKKQYMDILIIDTAGRLHIDEAMMDEIKALHHLTSPAETLFVVDSMTGQDAALTAKAFHEALPLTGVILTKVDGDARGGAALSVRALTEKPIKFIGTGEKIDALEPFYPERIASRILDMGDMLTLIEEIERKTDKETQDKLTRKLTSGKGFDLDDFRTQLMQMNQMGGINEMMKKLPGMGAMVSKQLPGNMSEKLMKKNIAMLDSMTIKERKHPRLIIGSRKKRIAVGSGTQIQDVNRLLKQFEQIQKMMQKFMKPGAMKNMMRGLGALKNPGLANLFSNKEEK